MNLCFFHVKRISDVNFRFIIKGKKRSIAKFKVKLENGTVMEAVVCDKLADYMCSRKPEIFLVEGELLYAKSAKNYIINIKEIIKT